MASQRGHKPPLVAVRDVRQPPRISSLSERAGVRLLDRHEPHLTNVTRKPGNERPPGQTPISPTPSGLSHCCWIRSSLGQGRSRPPFAVWSDQSTDLPHRQILAGRLGTDGIDNQRGQRYSPSLETLMISAADPESMTAEERRHEVANLLARGLLRRVRLVGSAQPPPRKDTSNRLQIGLDLPPETRLSVAHDPRVNGSGL